MMSRHNNEELVPPDGGWGWLVLIGAMLVNILIPGTIKSFGVLFVEFMEVFDASPALAAWIPALCYFLYSSLGPISSILSVTLSYRTVTIIGGFFAASGMILCFWANSVFYLCISYGVFVGIGAGLSYPPTVYIVTSYFVRYRGLANGLCISGSSLGSIVLPHVLRLFIETYGYRGAILILGGITLHVWVGAIIFDPVEKHMKRVRVDKRCTETDGETHEMDLLLMDKTQQQEYEEKRMAEEQEHVVVQMSNNEDYDDENTILPIVSSSSIMTLTPDAGGSVARLTDGSRTTTAGTLNTSLFSPSVIVSPSRPSFQKSASSATVQNFKSPTLLSQTRNFQMARRDRDRDRKISAPIQRNPYYTDTEFVGQEVSSTSALHAIPEKMYESERNFFSSNATDTGLGAVAMAAEAAEAAAAVVVAAAKAAAATSNSRCGIGGSMATGHSSILTPRKSTSFTSSFQYISTPFHGSLLSIKPAPDEISLSSRRPRLDNNIDPIDDSDKIMMRVDKEQRRGRRSRSRSQSQSRRQQDQQCQYSKTTKTKSKKHFDISLLRDPLYLIILISNSTNAISYTNFVILLPAFGVSMQFDKSQAANLISIVSTFDLIGRIGGSALSDITRCPKHWYFVSGLLCSGLSLTFMSLAGSYSALSVFCAIFGLFSGIYVGITAVIMADMLGTERLISSYGISLFVNGVLQLIGPPICGYWYENTNSYVPLFTTFGLILIFGSSIWGFVPFLKRNNIDVSDAETTVTVTADSSANL